MSIYFHQHSKEGFWDVRTWCFGDDSHVFRFGSFQYFKYAWILVAEAGICCFLALFRDRLRQYSGIVCVSIQESLTSVFRDRLRQYVCFFHCTTRRYTLPDVAGSLPVRQTITTYYFLNVSCFQYSLPRHGSSPESYKDTDLSLSFRLFTTNNRSNTTNKQTRHAGVRSNSITTQDKLQIITILYCCFIVLLKSYCIVNRQHFNERDTRIDGTSTAEWFANIRNWYILFYNRT